MSWVGKSIHRKEDDRLIRGKGLFVDDYRMGGMLHLKLVRSPYAHAKILSVDVSAAQEHPEVVCTLTGAEVGQQCQPFIEIGPEPGGKILDFAMGIEKICYQGEPVAAVIARTPQAATDAVELVEVDYQDLKPVMDAETALLDQSVLHPNSGTNLVWHDVYEWGEVDAAFDEADQVVRIDRLHFHRFSSTPLENNAVIASWLPQGRIHFWCNNSFPAFGIQFLAPALGVSIDQIRVRTHDIGGSFGIKITSYPYMAICALASRKSGGLPVKWVESRNEHLLGSAHGNERTYLDTEVALEAQGVITAIRSRHLDDCGAYPRYEPLGCVIWSQVAPGTYKLRNLRIDFTQAVTNKCPVGPNRGYSRLQHLWFLERVIDICAHKLGIPGDEMRLRNYIRSSQMPYTTPNGCVYDSGDYPRMLKKAQQMINWQGWKDKQRQAREEGRWLGIGIGTTLDSGTNNFGQARIINPHLPFSGNSEVANIKLDMDGTVVVTLGSVPQGQAHETTTSQVVASELGLNPEMVSVRPGFDTEWNTYTGHSGTYASQFAVSGIGAVHGAVEKLKGAMKRLAAFVLVADPEDLEFWIGEQGPEVRVKGTDRSVNYWRLANLVNVNNAELSEELSDVTLNCRYVYRPPFQVPDLKKKYGNLTLTYAAQLHIAVIEVDRETYRPQILDYAIVDDCGSVIHPQIVQGQVHGAAAHGIGAALLESCTYDADGNLLTAQFSDYVPITALNMPNLRCASLESPSPFSYNGAKGMGEGGGAPLHAISAALQDALYSEGVLITDSHNPPGALFEAVQAAL
ncbi:MAG: xanthine dehydrogenase family protein molybdopterin-binding subunit [Acidobacteriota bacterium]